MLAYVSVSTGHANDSWFWFIVAMPFLAYFIGWCQTTIQEIGFWRFLLRLFCCAIVFPLVLGLGIWLIVWPFAALNLSFVTLLVLIAIWLPFAWRIAVSIVLGAFYLCIHDFGSERRHSRSKCESTYGSYIDQNYGSNSRWASK